MGDDSKQCYIQTDTQTQPFIVKAIVSIYIIDKGLFYFPVPILTPPISNPNSIKYTDKISYISNKSYSNSPEPLDFGLGLD